MQELVKDFSLNPLIPGAVLAALMEMQDEKKKRPLDTRTLLGYNRSPLPELVSVYTNDGVINAAVGESIKRSEASYIANYQAVLSKLPDICAASGSQQGSVHRLARALFASKLLGELLEILAPPDRSYEKTEDGTVDLLEKLGEAFCDIVGGAWAEFFPRGEVSGMPTPPRSSGSPAFTRRSRNAWPRRSRGFTPPATGTASPRWMRIPAPSPSRSRTSSRPT